MNMVTESRDGLTYSETFSVDGKALVCLLGKGTPQFILREQQDIHDSYQQEGSY